MTMNPKINTQTKRSSQWAHGDQPQYSFFVANDVDPSVAYVYCGGTSYFPPNHSTIYRTADAGKSWSEVFFVDPRFKQFNVAYDWMSLYLHQSYVGGPISMEISPTDPDMVMRTDGMFLFITRNGGKTWDVALDGSTAFLTVPRLNRLSLIDVNRPRQMRQIGSIDLPGRPAARRRL